VDEGCQRDWRAIHQRHRQQRQRAPDKSQFAVVVMPDGLEQQRPGGDAEQNADERERPRPAQGLAVESVGRRRDVRVQEQSE